MGESFATLRHFYTDRLAAARDALGRGRGVVGVVGNTVPRELVIATGRVPVLVAAERGLPTPLADVYMEPVIAPETRSIFEAALAGQFESFDLLVLSRPYAQLYYYLKEVYRLGRAARLPALHMFDLMQSNRGAVRAYNWRQTAELFSRLERVAGSEITDARLREAIALTNGIRGLQRQLLESRWQGLVSGTEALQAIGAGYFMPPAAYADALRGFLAESTPRADLAGRPRLLVLPAEPLSGLHLHAALEDAGALVVAEDDWWGARAPGSDVPLDASPREALFDKYWLDTASAMVSPADAREAWFISHAQRPDFDGVVFYLPPSDHTLGWDYPRLKAWLDERGKASLLVRADAAQAEGRLAIAAQVAEWRRAALQVHA